MKQETPNSCFYTDVLKNKQKLSESTKLESEKAVRIYRNEVNVRSIENKLEMVGKFCGIFIYHLPMVLRTPIHSQCGSLEPGFKGKRADLVAKFLCFIYLTFMGLPKGLLQDTCLCYA